MTALHTSQSQAPDDMGLELTLIVAATTKMGIGFKGGLPWKGLKKEMAYFRRVTLGGGESQNTVIMGRKTWDSIPPKFRPLKGRRNVVISRSLSPSSTPASTTPETADGPIILQSLPDAIEFLRNTQKNEKVSGKVFIIGGAQIYKSALEMKEAKRVLLTRVQGDFECDTYFPEMGEGWSKKSGEELRGWTGEGEEVEEEIEEGGVRYRFEMWER
ncbi:Dihydrofolate reductase-like protein [Glarea lozoyensis ATCC 20868]|uniref:Dihydrofolate reductase n=1 Tax=Glarea lozoyensis (strain ATCC 20868 / MF5171) TaxID=1116229 RepID=S3DM06_GLAL2|nr:Dihydrofolate reductase-like protein [Glarea lozoyensis ATCC 20868]EPE33101.1 Dihydrofolate reductase-like protein [Glarea lozoyensis ATCC 20868]